MKKTFGLWEKKAQAWFGVGTGPRFTPFQHATREEAESFCGQTYEARELNEVNLIEGLPYPDAAKKTAKVVDESGVLVAVMSSDLPWALSTIRKPAEA